MNSIFFAIFLSHSLNGNKELQADILSIAESFRDKPYIANSLENFPEPEKLLCRTDAFDCMTFVETVVAMATHRDAQNSERALGAAITKWRYRNGKLNGYSSRLHYASDWARDNVRNHLYPVELPNQIKTRREINFMSQNRKSYPALSDEYSFVAIKETEKKLSQQDFTYLPSVLVPEARGNMESGDIIMFVSSKPGLDVAHLGFYVAPNSFWHASTTHKKVVLENDLQNYLKKNERSIKGVQMYRLNPALGGSTRQ